MRATWRTQIELMPGGAVVERDDAVLLSSALPIALFNPVFVTRAPDEPVGLVAAVVDHYRGLGNPFVVYFRDEYAGGLVEACAAAGLVEHYRPPLMVMDPITAVPPAPAGVEVVIVDASTMADASRVLAAGFGMPSEAVTAAFPPALVDVSGFTVVLALVDGEPAASAACSVDEDLVGIYNVATAPEHRGRGLGTAVTWAAIAVGAADRGPTAAVLQASSAGAPVYERMGFVTRDRYRQLEGGV
jgi:ribosomal protein S18 acetylase RimI-like enzyme